MSNAVYVNHLAADEGQERMVAAYGRDKYRKLAALKQKFDPTNFFRLNHNIRPSQQADIQPVRSAAASYIFEPLARKELRRLASTGMSENPIVTFTEKQEWLQPVQEAGEALVKDVYQSLGPNARSVKNALHGVWLGHPLHAAITDVPIGSWTAALVLDLLESGGRSEYAAGADAAVAVGLVGAIGSAASGLTDWSDTHGKPQRIGALHGLLNVGAALLYTGSYIFRKADKRGVGRGLGFAGFGMVLASSYLGGELAYGQRIGVDHSVDRDELPNEYTKVCDESDLEEGQPSKRTADGVEIFLLKKDGRIFALANKCSHLGGPLSEGEVKDGTIQCPWHGSQFCLTDGSVFAGPATSPQPTLQVEVRNGEVLVRRQRPLTAPSSDLPAPHL